MFFRFARWCHRRAGFAALIIVALVVVVVVFGVLGLVVKQKLDVANTALWTVGQERTRLEASIEAQKVEYEGVITGLRAELFELRTEESAREVMAEAEDLTPDEVYRFDGMSGVTIRVDGDEAPNVRPSPRVSKVSFGRISVGSSFTLEHFYAAPKMPQEGTGSWIGVSLDALSEAERRLFPDGIEDADGVVWVSADYLKFSDWLSGYSYERVNLEADIAVNSK